MKNFGRGKLFLKAWTLFYKEIKKNHWTKVNFSVKWAFWAVAAILLTIWTAVGSGLGLIGVLYIYGAIVLFDLYLVCRDKGNSFSVFCSSYSPKAQVRCVFAILLSFLLILAGIVSFVLLVVQFNRAERGWFLIFSNLYVFLMILLLLVSSAPLVFIQSSAVWNLWGTGSLGICAVIHFFIWQRLRGHDSLLFRKTFAAEETCLVWLFFPAAAAALSFWISYRQACRFHQH